MYQQTLVESGSHDKLRLKATRDSSCSRTVLHTFDITHPSVLCPRTTNSLWLHGYKIIFFYDMIYPRWNSSARLYFYAILQIRPLYHQDNHTLLFLWILSFTSISTTYWSPSFHPNAPQPSTLPPVILGRGGTDTISPPTINNGHHDNNTPPHPTLTHSVLVKLY